MHPRSTEATSTLASHTRGDAAATERLFLLVYEELHGLAGRYMRGERPGHTLRPTALVNEAYIRMVDVTRVDWRGKTHFFCAAARQMRRVLVEHARAAGRLKRGANPVRVTLDEAIAASPELSVNLLALDVALERLARRSPRQSRVAELRVFGGLRVAEVAELLDISERTVKQDWSVAQAWLARALGDKAS